MFYRGKIKAARYEETCFSSSTYDDSIMNAVEGPSCKNNGTPPSEQSETATVANVLRFENVSVRVTCPYCKGEVFTATIYETGAITWLTCVRTVLLGGWLGCCLIPFYVDRCKDVVHSCPNCEQVLGRYDRIKNMMSKPPKNNRNQ